MGWDATTLRLVTKSLILVYITDTVFSTCKDLYLFIYSVQHDYVLRSVMVGLLQGPLSVY